MMSCLTLLRRRGQKVTHVRPESQERFVGQAVQRLGHTVWQTGGCRSWYQDQRPARTRHCGPALSWITCGERVPSRPKTTSSRKTIFETDEHSHERAALVSRPYFRMLEVCVIGRSARSMRKVKQPAVVLFT